MSDRSEHTRPREKLKFKGAEALTDHELLMAIIGSGTTHADVSKIAREIRRLITRKDGQLTYKDLSEVKSLGPAKASSIMAGYELWRRHFEFSERPVIDSPKKVVEQLTNIRHKKQEYFACLTLDGANKLIAKRVITIGTLTASLVHPREIFTDAITDRAASIVVAHNHPSGSLEPSDADRDVTVRLKNCGELLGIKLIDHIIVTSKSYANIL